jgi:hypothetical protein
MFYADSFDAGEKMYCEKHKSQDCTDGSFTYLPVHHYNENGECQHFERMTLNEMRKRKRRRIALNVIGNFVVISIIALAVWLL